MQTIDKDKEQEQLIKRIERAARTAKLKRLSQEESWRRYYDLNTSGREQEVEIECSAAAITSRAVWAEVDRVDRGQFPAKCAVLYR